VFAALLCVSPALAQETDVPPGPITVIIPTAVGGNPDVVTRIIGNVITEKLARPILVEPRLGAAGLVAAQYVARARPDGQTLLLVTGAHPILTTVHKDAGFDAVSDFAFISTLTMFPFVISVRSDHPAKSFQELIALSKRDPGKYAFTSTGVGSTLHLTGELINRAFNVGWRHVPYKGGTTALGDVVIGRVDISIETPTVVQAFVKSGKVRPLAVSSAGPSPVLPEVPGVGQFSPGFDVNSYLGVAAPARTPAAIVRRLNKEIVAAMEQEPVRQRLAVAGIPRSSTPEEFTALVSRDFERWRKLVPTLKLQQ
jgi:tripartite-type tricarboxylate transporter receptor subunit TctC